MNASKKSSKGSTQLEHIEKARAARRIDFSNEASGQHAVEKVKLKVHRQRAKAHSKLGALLARLAGIDPDDLIQQNDKADALIQRALDRERNRNAKRASIVAKQHLRQIAGQLTMHKRMGLPLERQPSSTGFAFLCFADASNSERSISGGAPTTDVVSFDSGAMGVNEIRARFVAAEGAFDSSMGTVRHEWDFLYVPKANGFGFASTTFYPRGTITLFAKNVCSYFEPISLIRATFRGYMQVTVDQLGTFPTQRVTLFDRGGGDGFAIHRSISTPTGLNYSTAIPLPVDTPIVVTVGVELEFLVANGAHVDFDFNSHNAFSIDCPVVVIELNQ